MSHMEEAEKLYEAYNLKELYTLMAKLVKEHPDDAQVLWWHARACFDYGTELPDGEKKKLYEEGLVSAEKCRKDHPGVPEGWKFNAILLSKIGDLVSTKEKVSNAPTIKEYSLQAAELAPNDAVVQHMLGAWHYNVANVSWAQRQAAKLLFGTPPTATFAEALPYLEKARELRPELTTNLLLLGHTHVQLKNPGEAKVCYEAVLTLPTPGKREQEVHAEAKAHLKKL